MIRLATPDFKTLNNVNAFILNLIEAKGYVCHELDPYEAKRGITRTVLTFSFDFRSTNLPRTTSVAHQLHLRTSEAIMGTRITRGVRSAIDEVPSQITFLIQPSKGSDQKKGFEVKIRTEAMKILKMRRLGDYNVPNQARYQGIVSYNERFIRDIMGGLMAINTEEPHVIKALEYTKPALFDDDFLSKLPQPVHASLAEANGCYISGYHEACSVMLRKAIETAITIKFMQLGKESVLRDDQGNDIGLNRKLKLLPDHYGAIRREVKELDVVKWFGDRGAHDFKTNVSGDDLRDKVAPRIRAFMAHLNLRID